MIEGYRDFQREADAFLKTAMGARKRPSVFTPAIVHGILSMAIEKHIMAILMASDQLPDNHTFDDLVHAMDAVAPLDPDLARFLLELNRFDDMCSLDPRRRPEPDASLVERMRDAACAVRDHADALLGPVGSREPVPA
jgi:hypothetical protein